jgi:hypothetical protein
MSGLIVLNDAGLPVYRTPEGGELPHAWDGSRWRPLGCQATRGNPTGLPRFSDNFQVLPRSQWKPVSYAGFVVPVSDQGQHGSCVWHAYFMALMKLLLSRGHNPPPLSPTFGYALGNGGVDMGMSISSALDIGMKYGCSTAADFPEGHVWKRQIPPQAYESARRFVLEGGYHVSTFDEIATAVQMGMFPVYPIHAGNDYGDLDREGVSPIHSRFPNHGQTCDGLDLTPSNRWALENINSWGDDWGDRGRNRLVEEHFEKECDAIVLRFAARDPQDANTTPRVA